MHSRESNFQDRHRRDLDKDSFSPRYRSTFRRELGAAALAILGTIGLIGVTVPYSQYGESWGKHEEGRTKNSISAVVSGIVAQRLQGDSVFDLSLEKSMWPDTRISGHTTSSSIDSTVQLNWHPAHFTAVVDASGNISGDVDKIEFDWKVTPVSKNVWTIERAGWKFNYTLKLEVNDGNISGNLTRPGTSPNYSIAGSYQDDGHVHISIDPSWGMGVIIDGAVTPSK